jgi:hypothetical protein
MPHSLPRLPRPAILKIGETTPGEDEGPGSAWVRRPARTSGQAHGGQLRRHAELAEDGADLAAHRRDRHERLLRQFVDGPALDQAMQDLRLARRQIVEGRQAFGLLRLVTSKEGQVLLAFVRGQQASLLQRQANAVQQFLEGPSLVEDPNRAGTDALGTPDRVRDARDHHHRDAGITQRADRMQRVVSVTEVEVEEREGRLLRGHRTNEVRSGGGIDHVHIHTVRPQRGRHGLGDQTMVLDEDDSIRHADLVNVDDDGRSVGVFGSGMEPTTDRPRIAIAATPPLVAASLASLLSDLEADVVLATEETAERFDLAVVIPDGPALTADVVVELSSGPGGFLRALVSVADGPALILEGSTTIIDFVRSWTDHADNPVHSRR